MALQLTHVKFALDIKNKFEIQDIGKYIAGTVYPDSRYITKINREKTHSDNFLSPGFLTNDFKTGWAVHVLCDRVQKEAMDKVYSHLVGISTDKTQGGNWWINISAIKTIQDIYLSGLFDVQPYLSMFDYVCNPNGESIEDLLIFFDINKNIYRGKKEVDIDDEMEMWHKIDPNSEQEAKLRAKCMEYMREGDWRDKVRKIYEIMLEMAKVRNF